MSSRSFSSFSSFSILEEEDVDDDDIVEEEEVDDDAAIDEDAVVEEEEEEEDDGRARKRKLMMNALWIEAGTGHRPQLVNARYQNGLSTSSQSHQDPVNTSTVPICVTNMAMDENRPTSHLQYSVASFEIISNTK